MGSQSSAEAGLVQDGCYMVEEMVKFCFVVWGRGCVQPLGSRDVNRKLNHTVFINTEVNNADIL